MAKDTKKTVVDSVKQFLIESHIYLGSDFPNPTSESRFRKELDTFVDRNALENTYAQSNLTLGTATDHLEGFCKLVQADHAIAPFVCIRASLEANAIASWLLEDMKDTRERVARGLALRHKGLLDQKRYCVRNRPERVGELNRIINSIKKTASKLDLPVDERERSDDLVARKMPNITDLVKIALNQEADYRLLSSVAHGHHWAINTMCRRKKPGTEKGEIFSVVLEQHLYPEVVCLLASMGLNAAQEARRRQFVQYGYSTVELEALKVYCDRSIYECLKQPTEIFVKQ